LCARVANTTLFSPLKLRLRLKLLFPLVCEAARPLTFRLKVYNSLFRSRAGAKLQLSAPTRGSRRDGLDQMHAFTTEANEEQYMRT